MSDFADYFDLVFDSFPSPSGARFIEAERDDGTSFNCGDWLTREDGSKVLRIYRASVRVPPKIGGGLSAQDAQYNRGWNDCANEMCRINEIPNTPDSTT